MATPRKKELPRGIRNNNPLNIRIGNVWLGEVAEPTDPEFEQFVHVRYGLRAAFVLLRRYIRHYKRDTLPQIISAWAPASENNTQRYIDVVSSLAHVPLMERIDYADKVRMCDIVLAMAQVECGADVAKYLDRSHVEWAYDNA